VRDADSVAMAARRGGQRQLHVWSADRVANAAIDQGLFNSDRTTPPDATVGRSEVGLALCCGGAGFLLPLSRHFFESLAGRLEDGLQPTHRLKTAQAHVAIKRIEFDSKTTPASPVGRNEGGARAAKWV